MHEMRIGWISFVMILASGSSSAAVKLKPETLEAWNQYVADIESELVPPRPNQSFLRGLDSSNSPSSVRAGEIGVAPVGHNPKRIPGGLIHHWRGDTFLPNSNIDETLAVVRDYARYKQYFAPLVVDSKKLGQVGEEYRFSMVMMYHSLFSSALAGQYVASFFRVSDTRWYGITRSTRLEQVDDFGRRDEQRLPPDEGAGYVWRAYSVLRLEQRDGGVYVELEAITLSRDIPVSFRWFVDPIVRQVARSSLHSSLEKTRTAVCVSGPTGSRAKNGD